MNRIKYEIFLAKTIDRSRFFRNFCQKCQSKKTKKSKQRSKKSNTTNHIFWFLAIILLPCKKEFKQVGLSRATLDPPVKVFHFNLTGLPSKSIQWVNNSTLLKSQGAKKYLLQLNYLFKKICGQNVQSKNNFLLESFGYKIFLRGNFIGANMFLDPKILTKLNC